MMRAAEYFALNAKHKPRRAELNTRQSAGFSLIELMIALTIGLVIMVAAGYTYQASKRVFKQNDGIDRAQESARGTLVLISNIVRNAGFTPEPWIVTNPSAYFYYGGSAAANSLPIYGAHGNTLPSWVTSISGAPSAAASNSDWFQITYVGCAYNGTAGCQGGTNTSTTSASSNRTDNTLRSCYGEPVPRSGSPYYQMVINVFFIAPDTQNTNVNSLYCATRYIDVSSGQYSVATQNFPLSNTTGADRITPLLQGVTSMSVSFGLIDSSNQTQIYTAAGAAALPTNYVATGSWYQTSSVQLNLIAQSTEAVDRPQVTQGNINAGYLQSKQSITIAIRNRIN